MVVPVTAASEPGAILRSRLAALWEAASRRAGALLFDLDGTLIDSEPMNQAAIAEFFREQGWEFTPAEVAQFRGTRPHEHMQRVSGPWDGMDPHLFLTGIVAHCNPERYPPREVPGAGQTLRHWGERVPVVVVTSAHPSWAHSALERLAAPPDLPTVAAGSYQRGKPHPEPYLLGAQRAGVEPASCLAFEDARAGITAARRAGVGCVIGVETTHSRAELLALGAHDTVPDLTALAQFPAI